MPKQIRLRNNIFANYAGAGWNALISFLLVPWYIKYLGIEAYGIIGFFASIQAVLYLLDMGLSLTFSREIAALSSKPDSAQTMRNLSRTFATAYWGIAIIAGLLFAGLAPIYAHHWLNAESISKSTITFATLVMGLGIIIRWPGNIYRGGLTGLQHQVDTNLISIIAATLRGFGAVGILHFVSPTLVAFFTWQLLINLLDTLVCRYWLFHRLPGKGEASRFDFSLIKERWRFAAGMTGISLVTLGLTQLDKLLLSKMVALREFGYYTLASTLSGMVYMAISPVTGAYFPKFTALIGNGNKESLIKNFHSASQFIAFMLTPLAITVAFNSKEVLLLWTRNPDVAENAHKVLTVVILGSMLNAFMQVPYNLQLASGITKVAFWYNIAAITFLTPAIIFLTKSYGIIGGASAWFVLNASYVVIAAQIMLRLVLPSEIWPWYMWSVINPLLIALLFNISFLYMWYGASGKLLIISRIVILLVLEYATLAFVTPITRERIKSLLGGKGPKYAS